MNQYCRYCGHALDYNGEATDFICEADAPCGNNGAGAFYLANKAKRVNKCKHFVYNAYDIFRYNPDGSFCEYKPRDKYIKREVSEPQVEQLSLEM